MRRKFELTGTNEEKFNKIERIIPRLMGRMQKQVSAVVPATILSFHKDEVPSDGLLFSCCVFSGKLSKIAFAVKEIVGKPKPSYSCVMRKGKVVYTHNFESNKLSGVEYLDVELNDGDFVEFYQTNPAEVTIKGVHLTLCMHLNQKPQIHKVLIDDLVNNLVEAKGELE